MDWKFKELEYSYDALEPYIDAQTMETHHSKHYKAYHTKALAALGEDSSKSVEEVLLTDSRPAIQNNGGGFFNHTIFWEILGKGQQEPVGQVKNLLDKSFGSFDQFKEKFADAAATVFGSGWVWLLHDEGENKLEIMQKRNQDHPLCGKKILMGLDVWEHAYYLKYQNRRPEYIEAFWSVVNWAKVEERFENETVFSLR
tara:strand:+ start:79 stop:675 length:597 start_codon:yes stop_codon:yes gene_type:complete